MSDITWISPQSTSSQVPTIPFHVPSLKHLYRPANGSWTLCPLRHSIQQVSPTSCPVQTRCPLGIWWFRGSHLLLPPPLPSPFSPSGLSLGELVTEASDPSWDEVKPWPPVCLDDVFPEFPLCGLDFLPKYQEPQGNKTDAYGLRNWV